MDPNFFNKKYQINNMELNYPKPNMIRLIKNLSTKSSTSQKKNAKKYKKLTVQLSRQITFCIRQYVDHPKIRLVWNLEVL